MKKKKKKKKNSQSQTKHTGSYIKKSVIPTANVQNVYKNFSMKH